jgi:hypothetical protein
LIAEVGEELRFQFVRDRHLAGGYFGLGCTCEAELTVAEGGSGTGLSFHANGRPEDAAGQGAKCVDVATAGGGVEGWTGGFVGKVFELLVLGFGLAEEAGFGIAGKIGCMFGDPGTGATLDFGCKCGVGDAQRLHPFLETQGVEGVDGEGAVTALRAAEMADKPWAGTPGRVKESGVDDLHELGILRGQAHEGKDTGWLDWDAIVGRRWWRAIAAFFAGLAVA